VATFPFHPCIRLTIQPTSICMIHPTHCSRSPSVPATRCAYLIMSDLGHGPLEWEEPCSETKKASESLRRRSDRVLNYWVEGVKAWRADGPTQGACIWEMHGVWGWDKNKSEAVPLREGYFNKHPDTGEKVCVIVIIHRYFISTRK
jgi:hypothetical protein